MATVESKSIDHKLVTAKNFEVQRALFAEMGGDRGAAQRHFLAAGHLELVLGEDYQQADKGFFALRSYLSAASCFWRAGQLGEARLLFKDLLRKYPQRKKYIGSVITDLEKSYPATKAKKKRGA